VSGVLALKVLVLGATGSVGRLVVEKALRRGHEVTALIRHPEKVGAAASRVTIIEGDALRGKHSLAAFGIRQRLG
jgi:putative NADH-flavin reductase